MKTLINNNLKTNSLNGIITSINANSTTIVEKLLADKESFEQLKLIIKSEFVEIMNNFKIYEEHLIASDLKLIEMKSEISSKELVSLKSRLVKMYNDIQMILNAYKGDSVLKHDLYYLNLYIKEIISEIDHIFTQKEVKKLTNKFEQLVSKLLHRLDKIERKVIKEEKEVVKLFNLDKAA